MLPDVVAYDAAIGAKDAWSPGKKGGVGSSGRDAEWLQMPTTLGNFIS